MHRRALLTAGLAVLAACSRQAPSEAPDTGGPLTGPEPADVIRPLYDPYLTPNAQFPSFQEQAPWSADLWALLSAMVARSEQINEPILDFDPVIGAQDHQLSNLNVVTEAVSENSHAVVRASFQNAGAPTEVVYDLVWENGAWRVNNIRGEGWDLRQIAAAPDAIAQ
jgi:hypothetical protein